MNKYSQVVPQEKMFAIQLGDSPEDIISKQIQDNQYEPIQKLVSDSFESNMITVEIGSWTGLSAFLISTIVQRARGKHYCVDWYKGNVKGEGGLTEEIVKKYDVAKIFRNNMLSCGLSETAIQIIKPSTVAVKDFEDETLSFIFIDGDHDYQPMINDFNCWYPKLKKGKIISGHDYIACKEAMKTMCKQYKLALKTDEDIWWITKPK